MLSGWANEGKWRALVNTGERQIAAPGSAGEATTALDLQGRGNHLRFWPSAGRPFFLTQSGSAYRSHWHPAACALWRSRLQENGGDLEDSAIRDRSKGNWAFAA